jgi:HSP20 family molecular chaperone IbpA
MRVPDTDVIEEENEIRVVCERIEASFENGVLTVTIPKSEKARRRKIEIHGTSDTSQDSGKEKGREF